LNFFSQHPVCQKRGTIIGLIDRVFHLSNPAFHVKNFELIINILLDNSYPIDFIFQTLRERIKKLINASNNSEQPNDMQNTSVFFTVPFVSSISEKFRGVTKDLNMRISYQSLNKLSRFIKVHKDPLPDSSKRNVVYKINCKSCDASYVGQTGRQLHTRISEHKNQIRHNTTNHSVITEHRLNYNHDFAWDEVEILDTEPFYNKRLMSEMLFIKRQKNSINLQTDVQNLHHTYASTIERLPLL
jgi:predicted GIY-YIG superfamily endonuclease